jgi:hypothetical protein
MSDGVIFDSTSLTFKHSKDAVQPRSALHNAVEYQHRAILEHAPPDLVPIKSAIDKIMMISAGKNGCYGL